MDYSKDLEPASPDGGHALSQFWTAPSDERGLFDKLFNSLDCLVLERSEEEHAFRVLHDLPEWGPCVISLVPNRLNQKMWVVSTSQLDDFMVGVEDWWNRYESGETNPFSWEEDWLDHEDLDLEATAIAIGPRKLLVIKRGAPIRRAYIQLMLEKKLNF